MARSKKRKKKPEELAQIREAILRLVAKKRARAAG